MLVSLCSDTDSLSQGSSVGSLCLEDDEDRNSLKNHFDTLASGLSDGTKHSPPPFIINLLCLHLYADVFVTFQRSSTQTRGPCSLQRKNTS